MYTEEELEMEGYVEAMNPELRDNLVEALETVYLDWKNAPLSTPEMEEYAKQDLLNFLEYCLEQI